MKLPATPFFGCHIGDGLGEVPAVAVEILGVVLAFAVGMGLGFSQDEGAVLPRPPAVSIGIFNAEGVCCYGTNTSVEELKAVRILGDAEVFFSITSLDLVEGTYKLDVAVQQLDGYPYDYHRLLYTFRVKSRTKDVGI